MLLSMTMAWAWSPSEADETIYAALSVREMDQACDEVAALVDDPLSSFRAVVEHADMPAWAGLRAATCIARLYPVEARADVLAWVGSQQTKGFALTVVGLVDELDEDLAVALAQAAVAGELSSDLAPRLAASSRDAVRAVAEGALVVDAP